MRERMIMHVAGPAGAGKTTFIERLLGAELGLTLCVRSERDPTLARVQESSPKTDPELRRYLRAGASDVARYRFAEPGIDEFFMSRVMENYSQAVFIEGDCPIDCHNLTVFVAPPPVAGQAILRRVVRDGAAAHQAEIARFEQQLASPEGAARLLSAELGEPLVALLLQDPRMREDLRLTMKTKLDEMRREPPPAATEHWALATEYAGIERAQLVVVNVRSEEERLAAAPLVADVARLRKDEAVFREVIGYRGYKLPVTAVSADLLNPKDAGVKKAVARVKRALKQTLAPTGW